MFSWLILQGNDANRDHHFSIRQEFWIFQLGKWWRYFDKLVLKNYATGNQSKVMLFYFSPPYIQHRKTGIKICHVVYTNVLVYFPFLIWKISFHKANGNILPLVFSLKPYMFINRIIVLMHNFEVQATFDLHQFKSPFLW